MHRFITACLAYVILAWATTIASAQTPVTLNTEGTDGNINPSYYQAFNGQVFNLCYERSEDYLCTPLVAANTYGNARTCSDSTVGSLVTQTLNGNFDSFSSKKVIKPNGALNIQDIEDLPALLARNTVGEIYAALIACNSGTGMYVLVIDLEDMESFKNGKPEPEGIFRLSLAR